MAEGRIQTFREFYKFYLTEHSNKYSRILHFIGTFLAILWASIMLSVDNKWLWFLVPVLGYSFAWFGHAFFEKNKPATFKYPFWSLISDFKLFFEILLGYRSFDARFDNRRS
ncbi:MAG: DUF962 domain-containing protein [Flavobacteriaceae bacterium]|nr:DUF962 domain-containing protein [Flavobacteriaceae bacterium]